jgi:hypothetical protein
LLSSIAKAITALGAAMDGEERETSDQEVERPKWTKEITPSVTHDVKIDEDDHGDDRASAQACDI